MTPQPWSRRIECVDAIAKLGPVRIIKESAA